LVFALLLCIVGSVAFESCQRAHPERESLADELWIGTRIRAYRMRGAAEMRTVNTWTDPEAPADAYWVVGRNKGRLVRLDHKKAQTWLDLDDVVEVVVAQRSAIERFNDEHARAYEY
jgi:hypothetical protein